MHRKLIMFLCCFAVAKAGAFAQTTILRIEYFFGMDPGFGLATPVSLVSANEINNLTFNVDVSALPKGLHFFTVRSQAATGQWSVVSKRLVYRELSSTVALTNISYLEYFIDTDPGLGNGARISVVENANVEDVAANIDISTLAEGGHYFYVRSRDIEGKFSTTSVKYFEIDNILPLKLLDYSADVDDRFVRHFWTTANEIGVSHFIVERSVDGISFTAAGRVEAKNGTAQQSYFLKETLPPGLLNASTIYYRLKMVDKDGAFSYSKMASVVPKKLERLSVSPNPATDFVNIAIPKAKMVAISSITGQTLYRATLDTSADTHTLRFNKLPAGTYLLKVVKENNETVVEKLLIQ